MTPAAFDRLDVLVASEDADFRRLAGAVLGQEGHAVHASPLSEHRLQRLALKHRPDVLVLDAERAVATRVCSALVAHGMSFSLVLVSDEESAAGAAGVGRWGSGAALLKAVAVAAAGREQQARRRPEPGARLRLVDDPA